MQLVFAQELSESSELRVAGQVRERLHLLQLTPHQVEVVRCLFVLVISQSRCCPI
jgi:hypothetical protein